jgi:hypothetical protein
MNRKSQVKNENQKKEKELLEAIEMITIINNTVISIYYG